MKQMNAALLASAEGHWMEASDNLKAILEKDSENYVVCSLFFSPFFFSFFLSRTDCLFNRLSTTSLLLY